VISTQPISKTPKETTAMGNTNTNTNRQAATDRFFALRDSGYDGPIDQDGNAVEDTTGVLAALRAAAQRR
jgi:hypothetical protein